MPLDQQPVGGFWRPVMRVTDCPNVNDFFTEGATLDAQGIRDICNLERLESLVIFSVASDAPSFELGPSRSLRKLDISYLDAQKIRVRDMPQHPHMRNQLSNCRAAPRPHVGGTPSRLACLASSAEHDTIIPSSRTGAGTP